MISFAEETITDATLAEAKPLLEQHWREIALYPDIPLDPDYEFYKSASKVGLLHAYSARDAGQLIGYTLFVVQRHRHYRSLVSASNDIIWIHPDHRKAKIGSRFCDFWDEELKKLGVRVCHINTKVLHPALQWLLMSKGYAEVEKAFEKRLG